MRKQIKLICLILSITLLFAIPVAATEDHNGNLITVSFSYLTIGEDGSYVTETVSGKVDSSLKVSEAAKILIGDTSEIVGAKRLVGWLSLGVDCTSSTVAAGKTYFGNYINVIKLGDKYLPAKMLSVQLQLNNENVAGKRDVRFVTTVDCLDDYMCAGFQIDLGKIVTFTTKNAYTSLSGDERTPAEAFVAESNYFIALTVTNFPTNLPFSIRAFVQLQDGTYVYGDWNKSSAGIQ